MGEVARKRMRGVFVCLLAVGVLATPIIAASSDDSRPSDVYIPKPGMVSRKRADAFEKKKLNENGPELPVPNPTPDRRPKPTFDCPAIQLPTGYPYNAGAIKLSGIDCQAADDLIRQAQGPCKTPDGNPPCEVDGFACRLNGEPATGTVPIRCVRGTRRVEWLWSGGY
jgi:hypothetical protein